MTRTLLLIGSLLFFGNASATIWKIDNVLSGTDQGFGFSSLHKADDSTPMSGSEVAKIQNLSFSGTFNDVSGAADFVLGLSNGDNLSLAGNLLFAGFGDMSGNSTLAYSGLTNLAASTWGTSVGLSSSGTFGFLPGGICGGCGGDNGPNSFTQAGGGLTYLTLWGADFGSFTFGASSPYNGSKIGMDVRLEMSAVPVPAAVWLFGTALLGFIGISRKTKVA
jgi:hypothetical protein